MTTLVERSYRTLTITQDLGLGMMLWMSHFFPDEPWAVVQRERALAMLERMWVDPLGYFCVSRRSVPSSSPSPITASRWACRRRESGATGFGD